MTEAHIPNYERLLREYPNSTLEASGEAVGLMPGQMGDSNVGHLNIGAGRIVYQDVVRINRSIAGGDFFENPALVRAMNNATGSRALHLMGLLSDGGVHSLQGHLHALLKMAKDKGCGEVYVHAFLDGRDVAPASAAQYLRELEIEMARTGTGSPASLSGRYYAMDRDKRWERVEKAYHMLTSWEGPSASGWREALKKSYEKGITDEFVVPVKIHPGKFRPIMANDSVIFFNFRADRAREITHALLDENFDAFPRGPKPNIHFCGMVRYEEGIAGDYAFNPLTLTNTLGEVVSKAGMRQLRIAETEKYAHVTFFINGKKDAPFPGEDRILIPSPKEVATYDLKPEMSAVPVTDAAVKEVQSGKYDLVILNYANPDMVGHTGVFEAAVRALETVDACLGRLLLAVLKAGGAALIIADHGNVEDLKPGTGSAHTYHSHNPVPCILVGGNPGQEVRRGLLADVAPTVLEMLGLSKPPEMDRDSLITTARSDSDVANC